MTAATCAFIDCGRPIKSRGWCNAHYLQQLRGEELRPIKRRSHASPTCSMDGCEGATYGLGLCKRHWRRDHYRRTLAAPAGITCTGPECDRPALRGRDLCKQHQRHMVKWGEVRPLAARGRSSEGKVCTGPECDRPAHVRGLCHSHYRQHRTGQDLRPISDHRSGRRCEFPDCGRPHAAKGWCRPHREQERAGKGMWPIGEQPRAPKPKPKPKPKPLKLPDNVTPLRREKPADGLPPGWFKPSRNPKRKPTAPTAKQLSQIIDVPPPNPQLEQMARENLIRMGADDLLDMLGLEVAS